MEELLKNAVVREKIKGLSPVVRKVFIEKLLDLYEQETEEMIGVIEESRYELRGEFLDYSDDAEHLRAQSRQLESRRKDYDDHYLRSTADSRNDTRLSFVDEQNKRSVSDIKRRGHRRPLAAERYDRSGTTLSNPEASTGSRPISVISSRSISSLPTPTLTKTIEEEKEQVMKNLTSHHRHMATERQRQADIFEQKREERRQKKRTTEEKALELLERAIEMDKRLAQKKSDQDKKIKERVEEMKRKKEKGRESVIGDSTV